MNSPDRIEDLYPLSPLQQGLLFHTLLSPDVYLPQLDLTLIGELDAVALKQAWQQVVQQTPALRTAFQWEKRDQPFQVVYRRVELPWQEQDWRDLTPACQQAQLDQLLQAERQLLDLKSPPLMRLSLIRMAETRYHLLWTQHHLILDGWSAGLVLKDVLACYRGYLAQSPAAQSPAAQSPAAQSPAAQSLNSPIRSRPPYRNYIAWLQQQDRAAAQAFWTERLRGFTEPTLLPIARPIPQAPAWAEQQIALSATTTAALKALAHQHQLTLNTVIQAAFAILLSRYSDCNDICFGATYATRSLPGAEAMIGLLINTLPVRVRVPEAPEAPEASSSSGRLIPWLQQLQGEQAAAMQYDYSSLVEIQSWSEIAPGTPLFESLLVFENYPVDASLLQSDQTLQIAQVRPIEWTTVPLTLLAAATDCLSFKLKFDHHRFPPDAIARLLQHLQVILESMIAQPDGCLSDLPLLTPAEQQQLLIWNQTKADYPQQPLPDLFEAQVERSPDAVAIEYAGSQLTYCELNHRANQLAHYLVDFLKRHSDQPEPVIAIYAERSFDLVISILATLKAGAAYLPLDPDLPTERLAFMLKDAQVAAVIVSPGLPVPEELEQSVQIVRDCQSAGCCKLLADHPNRALSQDSSISVIYTSGSTGVPKGVINTHRGIVNRLAWMQAEYGLNAADRVLQKTPFSFDVSVWEFFWPLLNGACLVLAKPGGHRDSAYLAELVVEQQITTLHFVPSMLQVFLDELQLSPALRRVFCSGEALPVPLAERFYRRCSADLHNLYGPTEAAIDVTYFPVPRVPLAQAAASVPIGRPIHNMQIQILDRHLRPVPIGVPGELHIGGVGLARGYMNRPDLTAERFIPGLRSRPELGQISIYKTGDRARYLADGSLEFLGRLDDQIKLRGFRIELGEVAAALMRYPAVQAAAVQAAAVQDTELAGLVAYVVTIAAPDGDLDLKSELTQFLQAKLPDYMIPAAFVFLDALPLLANGKLNRRALPASTLSARQVILPRNPIEEIVAAIWREVLRLETLSVEDRFFELGGNSLLATQANSRLRRAFQLDLPLRMLFEQPTVAALSERIALMQQALRQETLRQETLRQESPLASGRKEIEL